MSGNPSERLVLLVLPDDLLDVTRSALEGAGHRVACADRVSAVATAREETPDLVITSALDDGGSGFAVCRELQADSELREVPCLFFADTAGERRPLIAGATGFLCLPPDREDILETVDGFLERRELTAELQAALALLRSGRLWEAIDKMHAVTDDASENIVGAWSHYFAGCTEHAGGKVQEAVETLFSLLSVRRTFWRAAARIARILEKEGDEAAASYYELALEIRPELSDLRARLEAIRSPEGAQPVIATDVSTRRLGEQPTVLIADDSELALAIVTEALEEAGFRVVQATDGEEALELARSERPDILVLDGVMPKMTGFEVCLEVKENLYPNDPPKVLIHTGVYTEPEQRVEAMECYGADDVLAKGSAVEGKLVAAVREHLGVDVAGAGD